MKSINDRYDISDFIVSSLYDDSIVYDLGFGNTFLLNKILEQRKNIKYIGVDKDLTLCNEVRKLVQENNLINVEVYDGDMIEFYRCDCDICVFSRVFHHFNKEEAEKIFKNALKMISTKGRIIIVDSFRDYSNRNDRFNYLPLFFINQLSLFGVKSISCEKCEINSINVDELWKLVIDIENKTALISFKKYNDTKGNQL